ncbi:MAG TPA: signal peptidase I [Bryobacteraceae bacterium]|jgi:signal peptidase I|nr:signal peptidase I [Bryobacteraceae bacterium]
MDLPKSGKKSVQLPKIAVAAVAIGFFVGALALLAAIQHVAYVLTAVLPIAAGVTILRRRAWGGYGFALFETAQSLFAPALLLEGASSQRIQIAATVIGGLVLALLFFLAGRALSRAGASEGLRWPWMVLTVAFTVPLLFVRAYSVPSGSMENTLLIGDRVLVRVFPRPTPTRGDLIVFHYPLDRKQVFVKRVIGISGDQVRIKDRITYLNGKKLREPYTIRRFPDDTFRDNLPTGLSNDRVLEGIPGLLEARTEMLRNHVASGGVVVPAGKYFVLGDNRDNSLDSRYWGFVDGSDVIGEPFLIYDSQAGNQADLQAGDGKHGGTHTRWERIFKVL